VSVTVTKTVQQHKLHTVRTLAATGSRAYVNSCGRLYHKSLHYYKLQLTETRSFATAEGPRDALH